MAIRGISLLILFILSFSACEKKDLVIYAGKGGTSVIRTVVKPQSGTLLDSSTVYIKYNAAAAPDNNIYDDSVKVNLSDNQHLASFVSLKRGEYFLFAKSYSDSSSTPKTGSGYMLIEEKETTYTVGILTQ